MGYRIFTKQWNLSDQLDLLIQSQQIEPVVVVGSDGEGNVVVSEENKKIFPDTHTLENEFLGVRRRKSKDKKNCVSPRPDISASSLPTIECGKTVQGITSF